MEKQIDRFATRALLDNRKGHMSKMGKANRELIATINFKEDLNKRQRLESIMAGSIRPAARLKKSKLVESEKCPWCQCEKETQEHVFWECPEFRETRKKFVDAIELVICEYGPGAHELKELIKLPCFRNCGIANEDEFLRQECSNVEISEPDYEELPSLEGISKKLRTDELWGDGWLRIFTDGSVLHPEDWRIARGVAGVYFGRNHPFNTKALVHGHNVNSYRTTIEKIVTSY